MKGLNVFKEYFKDFSEQYVLIGGAACDIIFDEHDSDFRATKDLDLVLIVESLTSEFGRKFWQFIQDGEYENRAKSNGTPQFFRFDKPKKQDFPFMIELFAKTENALKIDGTGTFVPIPFEDEISSLSAILLNEDYYAMLLRGKTVISDITVLSHTYLIPFKAKAWLDLRERKNAGQHVDERDIKKHKNDVLRLATLLSGIEQCDMSENVCKDMVSFIDNLYKEPIELKELSILGVTYDAILEIISKVYLKY